MHCKQVDGIYQCEPETRLYYFLKEFEIGHRFHFPLVVAKSLVLIFSIFFTSHVHNDVSKTFLLAICAPIAAELATNIVVNVLFLVEYFPNLDTVTTFLRLQKTFEVVSGDVFVLALSTYSIINVLEARCGIQLRKTSHILFFQLLVVLSSSLGVILTFIDKKIYDFTLWFIAVVVLLTRLKETEPRQRLRDSLFLAILIGFPISINLVLLGYFEELSRVVLKFAPLVSLPSTVLFLPAFRRLFYCHRRLFEKKNLVEMKPQPSGWTENQCRMEKTTHGMYLILPPRSTQTRIPLRSQLPDYSKFPFKDK